jgi:hypothetical protein
MEFGMATTKVTVTLETAQLLAIREIVERGLSPNVSAFVKHAVAVSLSDVAGWGALLGRALDETGGPLTGKERAWADSVLKARARPKPRRRAA